MGGFSAHERRIDRERHRRLRAKATDGPLIAERCGCGEDAVIETEVDGERRCIMCGRLEPGS